MRKKMLPLVIALSCLVTVGFAVFRDQPHNPVHNGRTLTEWLACLDSTNPPAQRQQGIAAVKAIGTNALPILIQSLKTDGSTVMEKLLALRRYQTMLDFTPNTVYHWRAIYAFRALGTQARPAIPELSVLLNEESTCVSALFALMAIGPEVKPVLENALASQNEHVRYYAAWGLDRMRTRA